jgi:AraC-like DNA-binding protein
MGALRAAELAAFGMEGVGEIFATYRDGTLEDDDEVAVAHGPAAEGYQAQSEAMVNIRRTLAAAQASHVINPSVRIVLERIAKELFYPERSYPLLLRRAAEQGLPAAELDALRAWLPRGRVDQKREDALAMLRTIRERLAANPGPKQVDFTLEHTVFWDEAMRAAGEADPAIDQDSDGTALASVLEELRLEANGYARVYERAMLRHLALREAGRAGVVEADGDAVAAADRFRRARGLVGPEDLTAWLMEQRLTGQRYDELMREEALVHRARQLLARSVEGALPDDLRLHGEYGRLLARAHEKARLLREQGLQNPGLEATGLTAAALLQWYFASLGQPVPESVAEYAREAGFADYQTFVRAVLREHCYLRLKERFSH